MDGSHFLQIGCETTATVQIALISKPTIGRGEEIGGLSDYAPTAKPLILVAD